MPIKYSDNKLFRIDTRLPHLLFAHRDIPVDSKWLTEVIVKNTPKNMVAYKSAVPLTENDCLLLAESLAIDTPGYVDTKCVLKEHSTKLVFGFTDAQNIKIATSEVAAVDGKANPDVGQAYAIVRTTIKEDEVPYHIAYVMFKDGSTNVTMEADAGDPDLKHPVFDMYDMKNTFHKRYSKLYNPAKTIVLKKR